MNSAIRTTSRSACSTETRSACSASARPRRGQFEAQRIERGSQRVCPTHSFVREFGTPIGRYGGALSQVRTDDLAATPLMALREQFEKSDWESVDEVMFGCANQSGEDNRNVARMASLLAGVPCSVPGATVNRLCGSG